MESKKTLYIGQKLITPQGEGQVVAINGQKIEVTLLSRETKSYDQDTVTDNCDAG